ncbi:MAG: hypothetical protein OK454_07655, partial [Thaumarchaeota archaeon]|nr:hypothetical protein [Nitrososphaerota archaeon]
ITVVVGVNNTVEWTNNDTASHTVTPSNVPTPSSWPAPGSGNMVAGATYTYTFTVPGSYTYICAYHNWMIGYVTVLASTTPTPEFPVAAVGPTLFVAMALLAFVVSRAWTSQKGPVGLPAP